MFTNVFFLPFLFFLMWIFYFGIKDRYQHVYVSLNGLILNTLALCYFTGIWCTILNCKTIFHVIVFPCSLHNCMGLKSYLPTIILPSQVHNGRNRQNYLIHAIFYIPFTVPRFRKLYYQESRAGHYSGPLFIFSHVLSCIPFNFATCLIAGGVFYQ